MSEFDEFDTDDDQQEIETRRDPVRARLKQVEKELKQKDILLQQYAESQKKLMFIEAGVPMDSPMASYFVKGYDGDLTPEAIRQAAIEAQLVAPQPPVDEGDKQAWKETNKVAAGAEMSPNESSWVKRIQNAQSQSELETIFAEAQAQGVEFNYL